MSNYDLCTYIPWTQITMPLFNIWSNVIWRHYKSDQTRR